MREDVYSSVNIIHPTMQVLEEMHSLMDGSRNPSVVRCGDWICGERWREREEGRAMKEESMVESRGGRKGKGKGKAKARRKPGRIGSETRRQLGCLASRRVWKKIHASSQTTFPTNLGSVSWWAHLTCLVPVKVRPSWA